MMSTDLELLQRYCATRDADAFSELVRLYAPMVLAVARRVTGSMTDAEDICQACFFDLANRCHSITGSVGGYLQKAAAHRAVDTVRNRRTRMRHEGEVIKQVPAMQRERERNERARLDEVIAHVDVALSELPDSVRGPLIECYLRGRSQSDIANELGLNQSTISRRLGEGIEQIRVHLARAGVFAPTAMVPVALTHDVASIPSASLSATLGNIGVSGVTSTNLSTTSATTLPVTSGQGVMILFMSLATLVILAVATFIFFEKSSPRPLAQTTLPAPTVLPELSAWPLATPTDEAAMPGDTVIAYFSVALQAPVFNLDEPVVATLRNFGASLKSLNSGPVELYQGTTDDLFTALRRAQANGETVLADRQLQHDRLIAGTPVGHPQRLRSPQFWNDFAIGEEWFTLGLTWSQQNSKSISVSGNDNKKVNLRLKDDQLTTFVQAYAREPRERRSERWAVDATTSLSPGEAVVCIVDVGIVREHRFYFVSVWHAYRATERQYQHARMVRHAEDWLRVGPEGARQLSDRAASWSKGRTIKPEDVTARWTQTTSNGATVRLLALGRPSRWPFCWWNADANPISNDWTGLTIGLKVEKVVVVSVETNFMPDSEEAIRAKNSDEDRNIRVNPLPGDARSLDVWVANGPYTEQRVKPGDQILLGNGGTVRVVEPMVADERLTLGLLRGDLGPEIEVWLNAIDRDGKRHAHQRDDRAVMLVTAETPRWTRADENLHIAATDVDHYVLRWRKRERVTFEDFADNPAPEPQKVSVER